MDTKTFLENWYDQQTKQINWSFVETVPEFARLAECQQNPKWHSEGNALEHTKLACKQLEGILEKNYVTLTQEEQEMIRLAVLLHDIGKGVTTTMGKDGNWHQYGHELAGERIARMILWEMKIRKRELICALIKYHMEPLRLFDSKSWVNRLITIGANVPWKFLWIVKMADLYGSVQENGGTMEQDVQKMHYIKKFAQNLNVWDVTDTVKLCAHAQYFNQTLNFPWTKKENRPTAYLTIGLPGAGKSTYIDKKSKETGYVYAPYIPVQLSPTIYSPANFAPVKGVVTRYAEKLVDDKFYSHIKVDGLLSCETKESPAIISRDDVRFNLGYGEKDEKTVLSDELEAEVTKVCKKLLDDACHRGVDIFIADCNLKREHRDKYVKLLKFHGYRIEYIYIEAPSFEENCKRREGQIEPEVMRSIALGFEWPEACEYDILRIIKQK